MSNAPAKSCVDHILDETENTLRATAAGGSMELPIEVFQLGLFGEHSEMPWHPHGAVVAVWMCGEDSRE